MTDYVKIPIREGYRNFYIYISRILALIKHNKATNKPLYYIISIDEIARIFDINQSRNDLRKTKVRECLNKILNIVEVAKFQYSFVKNGGRYAYFVQFEFQDDVLNHFDEKLKAVFIKSLFSSLQTRWVRERYKNLSGRQQAEMIRNNPEEHMKDFMEWMTHHLLASHKGKALTQLQQKPLQVVY